jgi:hypothetical protein
LNDRTIGYQAGRNSPFSIWGQNEGLEWLHVVTIAFAVLLALAVAFVPRRKSPMQVAALAAAVMIAIELTADHWFYLYIVWFAPLVLVAAFLPLRTEPPAHPLAPARSADGFEQLLDPRGAPVVAGFDQHPHQPRVLGGGVELDGRRGQESA